jgi:transcriptional regulator with XRE-family HTH domain
MDIATRRREPPPFGRLLQRWRSERRVSQLQLATHAGISGRHLSFLETGRSQPSREMVQHLANALDVPLAEQNALLLSAGYAPLYGERDLSAPELTHVRRAVDCMLQQQEPFPAMVIDGRWNALMRNNASRRIFGLFHETNGAQLPVNVMHAVFRPDGIRRYLLNWEELAGALIQTVHREALAGIFPGAAQLRDELLSYPGVPTVWHKPDPLAFIPPLLTLRLRKGDLSLEMFSTITTFSNPRDVTLQQIRIECFYPADAATAETARRLAAADASGTA